MNISLLNSIGIHSQCTLINSEAAKERKQLWMHCAHEYKTSVQLDIVLVSRHSYSIACNIVHASLPFASISFQIIYIFSLYLLQMEAPSHQFSSAPLILSYCLLWIDVIALRWDLTFKLDVCLPFVFASCYILTKQRNGKGKKDVDHFLEMQIWKCDWSAKRRRIFTFLYHKFPSWNT